VYEGEQEGPYQVAVNLLDKAIRTHIVTYFQIRCVEEKRATVSSQTRVEENPIRTSRAGLMRAIIRLFVTMKDAEKINALYKVRWLVQLCKKNFSAR
jgi:magnesium chelatase subunit I